MQNNTPANKNPKATVIIPFYQKEKGILCKALTSALNQKNISNFEIIVIDDDSPVPAEEECSAFTDQQRASIKIIQQENKGPAAARNKGLDSVAPDTVYIAFLDSDDEWTSDHLDNAITALEAGNDFYFSDLYQLEQTISGFNRAKRINVNEHPLLFADNPVLHRYVGNMQEQIVTGNIIGTSTVVYRYSHCPSLRFREDLVRAGEDYLFWLAFIATKNTNIAFSSAAEAVYGKGVNIYSGTQFGTPEYLELVYYETKYRKTILKEFALSSKAKNIINVKLKEQKLNFLRGILHALSKKKLIDVSLLLKYLILTPEFLISVPIDFFKILKERK
jgi:succinoglycan biosynthesis protein ExoW